ncbi:hypothetical protein A9Q84_01815 [Halobacteriovorax marinus]|uniref:Peptidase S9 prolyl oligopeptidase catalytic domain-containing protein n=1 Tax=Halobacteriovorax marinus TaxID=97084 RepID=A0A1Y5FCH6_9BACT|nr:hypothetical protein A9Q84_01815 [Halobacteriovorax marinus]
MKKIIFPLAIFLLFSCATETKKKYAGHGAESISQSVLDKYQPTSIPSELSREIEGQHEIRSTSLGLLTPDGKNMFFSWSVTGTRQIWKIDGPKRFPVQMTGGENRTSLQDITNDGKYLILSRDKDGNEYPALYLQSTKGGELKLIFGKDKVKMSYMDQSADGQYIYFRANDESPTIWNLYKYHIKTKKKQLFYQGKGYWYIVDLKTNGDMILGHAISNVTSEYFLFNEKTKSLLPIVGQGENESYRVRFAPVKGTYFILTNKFSDFKRLYLYDGKKFTPITPKANKDVTSFSVDKSFKRLLVTYNDHGFYKMDAYHPKSLKKSRLPRFSKSLHTYYGSTTVNSRYTTFGQSFHNKPRSSYVYDWKKKTLKQWTLPSSPEIDPSDYRPWSLEYYDAKDGTKIPMLVKRPKGCEKKTCPVVVSFHGGPEGQSLPSFSPYSELFVKRGFIFVKPNVRGSKGLGKKWLNSDNAGKRLDVITDIRDCSIHIKKNWSFNGVIPKVGVMGGSYGGYSTLYAMTVFSGHYQAGVARVGMSSLVTFLQNTAEHRRYLRESEYGHLIKDREILEKLSPINYLSKLKDPLLIIQGANDPRVPAGESIQFKEALDRKGINSTLILFPDEGHGVRKRRNRTLSTGHTLNFFIKNLL